MRTRIKRMMVLRKVVERLATWLAFPHMAETTIVRNAEDERALGTLPTEVRQRLPDRQRDIPGEVFPATRYEFVPGGESRDGRTMLAHNAVELLLQIAAPCVHEDGSAPFGKQVGW